MDIDNEIRLMLRDLKFAAVDALLLRIRHGDVTTNELIQMYLLMLQRGDNLSPCCNKG